MATTQALFKLIDSLASDITNSVYIKQRRPLPDDAHKQLTRIAKELSFTAMEIKTL